jgi:terminase small subunit / prophage DNA-packing protein
MDSVSAEVLAKWCGLSSTNVASYARRGVMVRAGRGTFDLEQSIRGYCQHLREQASGRKQGDTPSVERARLAKAQADNVELRNAIKRGELVDAEASPVWSS